MQMCIQPLTIQEEDTHVSVYLDGKQITGYMQSVMRENDDRKMRATNSVPAPFCMSRMLGMPWGH